MKSWELMRRLSLRADDAEVDDPPEPEAEDLEPDEPETKGGLPEDVLPEFLRGRSAEDVKAAISQAFQAGQISNSQLKELREELNELKGSRKEPEPEEQESLEELLYKNPEEAIARVIEKKYGSRFAGLEDRVGSTVMATVRQELPDFDDVEDDVKDLLRTSRAPATRENILGAYQMILGRKAMEERQQQQRRRANPEKPKARPPAPAKPKLSELEAEIARGMGMTSEDYASARDNEDFDIKVPT